MGGIRNTREKVSQSSVRVTGINELVNERGGEWGRRQSGREFGVRGKFLVSGFRFLASSVKFQPAVWNASHGNDSQPNLLSRTPVSALQLRGHPKGFKPLARFPVLERKKI